MEKETVKQLPKVLINKIIEVRAIPRVSSLLDKPIAFHKGAASKLDLPMDIQRNSRVEIFKEGEQEAFEKELSLPKGTLSTHNRENPYWNKFLLTISNEGLVLNLANPTDALKYRVLLANESLVAKSWNERNDDARYRFALVEQGYEDVEINKKNELIKEAYKLFGRIEDSADKMRDVLRVLGKKVTGDGVSVDSLKAHINRIIDDPDMREKFVNVLKDKDFDTRILIDKALQAKALYRLGKNGYRLPKGEESIADDTKEMIDWLNDPKNSVKVETIKAQIEATQ